MDLAQDFFVVCLLYLAKNTATSWISRSKIKMSVKYPMYSVIWLLRQFRRVWRQPSRYAWVVVNLYLLFLGGRFSENL